MQFDPNKGCFTDGAYGKNVFGTYLVTMRDGTRCVCLAESVDGARGQCSARNDQVHADVKSVKPIPFVVRGWGNRRFSPVNEVLLNDKHSAIVRSEDGEVVVNVGCQEFPASAVRELYEAVVEEEKKL